LGVGLTLISWWIQPTTTPITDPPKAPITTNGPVDPAIAAQRPWVEIVEVKLEKPLTITQKEFSTELSIAVRNHGNTPATNVGITSQMVVTPIPVKENKDLEVAVRKASHLNSAFMDVHSSSLFPKSISIQRHLVTFLCSDISPASTDGSGHTQTGLIVLIGGSVDYLFWGGKGQTTFNFILSNKNGSRFDIKISPRTIPIENLTLWPEPHGVHVK
jgi:hypothetical protein